MCIYRCHALRCVCEHVINSTGIAVAMHPPPKYHEPNINATNSGVYQYMSRTQMYINTCHELRCVCMHELKRHRSISRRSISICVYMSQIQKCTYKCHELRGVCTNITNSRGIAVSADAAYPYVYMCHEIIYVSINVTNSDVYVYISRTQQASQCQPTPLSKSSTQRIHMLHAVSSLVMITHTPKMSMYSIKTKVETYVRICFSI